MNYIVVGLQITSLNKFRQAVNEISEFQTRILFQEQIKKNLFRKNRICCNFSHFSEDILLNQIFKYASWLLIFLTRDSENHRMLKEIDFILSDISFKRIKPADFDALHLDRLNYCYRPLVDLARLFILHSTVELTHDRLQTFSFLFDMDELFEQFIAGFMIRNRSKLLPEKSGVKYHDKSKHLIDHPEPIFRLIPDILVSCEGEKLIIDTKYKILDPKDRKLGVSQSDLYQVIAYALKHECPNVVLLYPAHLLTSAKGEPYVVRYDGKEIRIFVRTIDLNIDMQTQKQLLVEQLEAICACVF